MGEPTNESRSPDTPISEVTRLLVAAERGDPDASEQLWPLVYAELRQLAGALMARERPGQTLDATALVHEAYLRLGVGPEHALANRHHFFAAAATAMRRILVESARSRNRAKRGGARRREFPELDGLPADAPPDDLLALNDALDRLAEADPVKAKLVELRFFGGLTLPQVAECLDISLTTAERGWRFARTWLFAALADTSDDTPPADDKS